MNQKGFTKAVSRLPHTLSTKTGLRDETKDPEFQELANKFAACETATTALVTDVAKFRDSVTAMLNHEAEFGIVLAEIYDPTLGAPAGDVTPRRTQTAPEAVKAVDDFQAVMREIRDLLLPEVDKLDGTIVAPLNEMQNMMKMIRKTITKREHKLIDYDRHRIALKKLQDKKERSLSDEKQIYKLESQLEVATADYQGLNGLLIEQLPGFFYYRTQLMEPIFYAFYYLQLRIFTILLDRIEPLSKTGYFDLTMDVLQGYEARKHDTAGVVDAVETITKKSAVSSYQSKYGRPGAAAGNGHSPTGSPGPVHQPLPHHPQPPPAQSQPWRSNSVSSTTSGLKPWQKAPVAPPMAPVPPAASVSPPPAYTSATAGTSTGGASSHSSYQSKWNATVNQAATRAGAAAGQAAAASALAASKAAIAGKRPPPPVPKRLGVKYVLALYDYDAQEEGDLSFRKDDKIEIVERTANADDWWTGRLNGRQGVFPGNYVQEI
ncbi:hypothetical protein DFQ26_008001 [Actinomortierella ambigua]|nr:hypothetical protein DFQ26_008001 [Actinomortierella ambigua]